MKYDSERVSSRDPCVVKAILHTRCQKFVIPANESFSNCVDDKFTKVVILRLTCLDRDRILNLADNQSDDADGVAPGVQYIQKSRITLIQTHSERA